MKAIEKGVEVRGYYYWSFYDNFEWSFGYTKRFGLVRVNYETQKRYPKASFQFFKKICGENGIHLNETSDFGRFFIDSELKSLSLDQDSDVGEKEL